MGKDGQDKSTNPFSPPRTLAREAKQGPQIAKTLSAVFLELILGLAMLLALLGTLIFR